MTWWWSLRTLEEPRKLSIRNFSMRMKRDLEAAEEAERSLQTMIPKEIRQGAGIVFVEGIGVRVRAEPAGTGNFGKLFRMRKTAPVRFQAGRVAFVRSFVTGTSGQPTPTVCVLSKNR